MPELMAVNEQEKLLFPSEWCKRFDSASALEHAYKFGKEESEKNAKDLNQSNVRYGTGERQLLDIYYKSAEKGSPIILFVHGGYWQEFSKDMAAYWIGPYVERGYRVIVAGYDLCPSVTLAALIAEIKACFKFVLDYAAKTDTETVCIMGHSAGAHLVISALDKESTELANINLLKGLFLMAGVYDLNPLINTSVNENNMLTLDESNVNQLSPLFNNFEHLKELTLKIYSCVGEYESPFFIEQSRKIGDHLKEFGAEFKYLEKVDHFDIVENLVNDDYDITKLLVNCMKG